jgi:lycopene beta-cyclase
MSADVVLVGGGLANCLIAYRLANHRPELDVVVLERGPALGGHHTWSFHEHDLSEAQWTWMRHLVEHSWPWHELRFPRRSRTIHSGYHTISSKHLSRIVVETLGDRILVNAEAREVTPHRVDLADGTTLDTACVIDGRGDPASPHIDVGFQKFVGRFVVLENGHGMAGPVLMDATVDQLDGFRFVYTLPLDDRSLLIEDTYYSDTPSLDREQIRSRIGDYAASQRWHVSEMIDEEAGVLPIVLSGDIELFWDDGPAGVPRSGMRAALFHPTTGYSLPEAVRLADHLARQQSFTSEQLYAWTRRRSEDLWRTSGFFRLLNRMLFRAADPDRRYRVLERFYGLPEPLIRRFYAGRLSWTDKVRLVTGSPPVPIGRAFGCLIERRQPRSNGATADTTRRSAT